MLKITKLVDLIRSLCLQVRTVIPANLSFVEDCGKSSSFCDVQIAGLEVVSFMLSNLTSREISDLFNTIYSSHFTCIQSRIPFGISFHQRNSSFSEGLIPFSIETRQGMSVSCLPWLIYCYLNLMLSGIHFSRVEFSWR